MATANPALNEAVFRRASVADSRAGVMTLEGTVIKTSVLVVLLLITAFYTWGLVRVEDTAAGVQVIVPPTVYGLLVLGCIGGLITAMVTIFAPRASPFTAPLYAALEGLVLGGISALFEVRYPGIAVQAVGVTTGTLLSLLILYGTRMVRVTEKFKMGVIAATGGICIVYLIDFIMSFFGTRVPFIHESGMIGIGFSLVVVVIAAMNLLLDFDFIERGVEVGAPKYMEWYGGFGLMVTLIWLYIEVLRLLAKLRNSRD
jgi:uncharacterized YccA/Bax inhibitor family protein